MDKSSVTRTILQKRSWQSAPSNRVCSIHFVDWSATDENPIPTLFLGYESKEKKSRGTLFRKPLKKTWGKVILHLPLQLLKRGSTTASNFCNFFFRNNIIFYDSHLFLPATYTLRVLIDVPPLINFFDFFGTSSLLLPTPCSNIPPLFIIFSNLFEPIFFFIHIDWYTCKILSNLVNFPYFNSCLGLVFI